VQKMVEDARATQLCKMQSEQFKKYVRVKICNERFRVHQRAS